METMVLLGAEQLVSAMHSLRDVAQTIDRASGNCDNALKQHQAFMDDWLLRFQGIIDAALKEQKK